MPASDIRPTQTRGGTAREGEHEHEWGLGTGVTELRQDVRRLDGRLLPLLVAQIATLGTALAAAVATVAG
jgi:hypothetical protein